MKVLNKTQSIVTLNLSRLPQIQLRPGQEYELTLEQYQKYQDTIRKLPLEVDMNTPKALVKEEKTPTLQITPAQEEKAPEEQKRRGRPVVTPTPTPTLE